jgi:hypothetical protein
MKEVFKVAANYPGLTLQQEKEAYKSGDFDLILKNYLQFIIGLSNATAKKYHLPYDDYPDLFHEALLVFREYIENCDNHDWRYKLGTLIYMNFCHELGRIAAKMKSKGSTPNRYWASATQALAAQEEELMHEYDGDVPGWLVVHEHRGTSNLPLSRYRWEARVQEDICHEILQGDMSHHEICDEHLFTLVDDYQIIFDEYAATIKPLRLGVVQVHAPKMIWELLRQGNDDEEIHKELATHGIEMSQRKLSMMIEEVIQGAKNFIAAYQQ